MNQKSPPSIEAALTARIDGLEKRIKALESGHQSGETVSKKSVRLVRPEEEKAQSGAVPVGGKVGGSEGDEETEKPVGDLFEIISVDSRAFERDPDEDRCKFSWKIVVQSHSKDPILLNARLEFVDMDSYLVEEDSASGYRLEPGARGKFRGYKWISNEAEYQIVGVRAHLAEEVVGD